MFASSKYVFKKLRDILSMPSWTTVGDADVPVEMLNVQLNNSAAQSVNASVK